MLFMIHSTVFTTHTPTATPLSQMMTMMPRLTKSFVLRKSAT
jgi:hypothetical protein